MTIEPEIYKPGIGTHGNIGMFGLRALIEQLGAESLNPGVDTIFRFYPGYVPGDELLILFYNGSLQDPGVPDYAETDARTFTMAVAIAMADRLVAMSIGDDVGSGGLAGIGPPVGAGAGPYTVAEIFTNTDQLLVWDVGTLQTQGALLDYTVDVPNNQFTFNAPPAGNIVAAVIRAGVQGMRSKEVLLNEGPFPGLVTVVTDLDKDNNGILVFLDGLLMSENFDYYHQDANNIQITNVVLGANHTIHVYQIAKSNHTEWRA